MTGLDRAGGDGCSVCRIERLRPLAHRMRDRFGVVGLQKLVAFGEELVEDRDG
jgi:hypothetical protein